VLFVATALILPLNGGQAFGSGHWAYPVYLGLVTFGFVGWFWTHGGQTLGMKAWRLRLLAADGMGVGWGRAALRFTGALLSFACLGLGYWWMLVDPDGLAWHDRLSDTRIEFDRQPPRDPQSRTT
jgi:uncharacterized RDD family membrane protein YckC